MLTKDIIIDTFSGVLDILDNHYSIPIILGWLVLYLLDLNKQNRSLKQESKIKVYEEIYKYKKEYDQSLIDLSVKLGKFALPFIMMDSCKIGKTEVKARFDGSEKWREFMTELINVRGNFTDSYLKLWNHLEMWEGLFPELKKAGEELFKELSSLDEKTYKYYMYLQDVSIKEYDWYKWDREEMRKEADRVYSEFNTPAFTCVNDYIALVHNSLISSVIKNRKSFFYRKLEGDGHKPLARRVLTKKGFVEKDFSSFYSKIVRLLNKDIYQYIKSLIK